LDGAAHVVFANEIYCVVAVRAGLIAGGEAGAFGLAAWRICLCGNEPMSADVPPFVTASPPARPLPPPAWAVVPLPVRRGRSPAADVRWASMSTTT
jgi:hypothetical protein